MTTNELDLRGQTVQIGVHQFPAPVSFDDVSPTEFKRISLIPWFDSTTVRADAESEFSLLALFGWDAESYWNVSNDALASRVLQRITAVADVYLSNYSTIDVKRDCHVSEVAKGL